MYDAQSVDNDALYVVGRHQYRQAKRNRLAKTTSPFQKEADAVSPYRQSQAEVDHPTETG